MTGKQKNKDRSSVLRAEGRGKENAVKYNGTQPMIEHFIDIMKGAGPENYYVFDDKTLALLDELFELMKRVEPYNRDGHRSLWLTAERGGPEDFADMRERIRSGEYEDEEDFLAYWKERFPYELEWYNLTTVEDARYPYRAVFLANELIIQQGDREKSFDMEVPELARWLVDSVKGRIRMLEDGTYNDFVRENLPPRHRTGTVLNGKCWDAAPRYLAKIRGNLSDADVEEFCVKAYEQEKWDDIPYGIKDMTANDFFRFCAMGYSACGYEDGDRTPKERYVRHSDGRDDGLTALDPDSPEAFADWLYCRSYCGGHPWEVCGDGKDANVTLSVKGDRKGGYRLYLDGDSWTRSAETSRFYLALTRAGLPVYLQNAGTLADRLRGKERLGIIPGGGFPVCRGNLFPGETILDFINLPPQKECAERILPHCVWQEIPETRLVREE